MYGRRRIGKTYLIRESFGYEFTFQHTGVSSDENKNAKSQRQEQLDKFSESLAEAGYPKEISSWAEAFDGLKEVIKHSKEKKKVIFIDELSWMDTKDCGLISELEHFWNGWVTARKEKDALFFYENAPLGREYDNLYRALFKKPDQYIKIIDALSSENKGIGRELICKKTGISGSGDLTKN